MGAPLRLVTPGRTGESPRFGPTPGAATRRPTGALLRTQYRSVFRAMVIAGFLSYASYPKVKDSPAKDSMPTVQHEKVVHARLRSGNVEIAASDWLRPEQTPIRGNTVCLFLNGGTFRELKALFERLSEGAQVTDPLKELFFGTYGALNDKFGVRWMFQTDKKD